MLLKAIHSIKNDDEQHLPGSHFIITNEAQAERLIQNGAAVPARKVIKLSLGVHNADDALGEDLIEERREQVDADKAAACPGQHEEARDAISGQSSGAKFGNMDAIEKYRQERKDTLGY